MQFIFDAFTNWIKSFLIGCITNNLSGMFDDVNSRVGDIALRWDKHRRAGMPTSLQW